MHAIHLWNVCQDVKQQEVLMITTSCLKITFVSYHLLRVEVKRDTPCSPSSHANGPRHFFHPQIQTTGWHHSSWSLAATAHCMPCSSGLPVPPSVSCSNLDVVGSPLSRGNLNLPGPFCSAPAAAKMPSALASGTASSPDTRPSTATYRNIY
jgi:hypothetical protein